MSLDLAYRDLTESIIGAAIKVHRTLGPGLLESAYEACMAREMDLRTIACMRQLQVPLEYEGMQLDCGYRLDLLVSDTVIVEVKSVDKVHDVYLRATHDLHETPEKARGDLAELQRSSSEGRHLSSSALTHVLLRVSVVNQFSRSR